MKKSPIEDQASGLRRWQKSKATQIITVTGGKGGVGKTNITLGMAFEMAKLGKRVMVLDADLGLANVDVLLGLRAERNLSHVLKGEASLEDIVLEGPHQIKIIPASSGLQAMTELNQQQLGDLITAFTHMGDPLDVLLVDTAAGISDMVMKFSKAAQEVLVVVCDEPTSITDAYALMKLLSRGHGVTRFKLVTNMVRSYQEGRELFTKLTRVSDKFLKVELDLAACIPLDERIRQSVKQQKIVPDAYPKSPASLALTVLAKRALTWATPLEMTEDEEVLMPLPELQGEKCFSE